MEEKMSVNERFAYLRVMKERYDQTSRPGKSRLLDEMACVTGLSRKHLIARMRSDGPYRRPRTRQRGRVYDAEVEAAVALVADSLGWICAERVHPVLRRTAQHLADFGEWHPTPEVLQKLETLSLATLQRMLPRLRPPGAGWPQARGRPREHALQVQVPIAVIPWQLTEPGHFEVDLVHHGAATPTGHVCTIQFVDVALHWSECFALQGCEFSAVWQAFEAFHRRCPIPVREIHSDNGSEFLNKPLQSAFGEAFPGACFRRSRPCHKNDNRFVEQCNASHVRAYLGDLPLHTSAQVQLLNALYEDLWLFSNLFQPVLRQVARTASVQPNGVCRIRRQHDMAQTPLERLAAAEPPISRQKLERLQALHEQTNLRALKERISTQLERLRASAWPSLE